MFWIKLLLAAVILLVILLVGAEFFYHNSAPVEVNYILGKATAELSWILFFAFCGGVLLTIVLGALFVWLPAYWRRLNLQSDLRTLQQEVATLKQAQRGVARQ